MTRAAALLLALALPGCTTGGEPGAPPPPPRSPEEAVEAVWALSRVEEPSRADLGAVFADAPLEKQTPRLLQLLDSLRPLEPEVRATEPLPGLEETAVDLRAELPSGGTTTLRLHARPAGDGTWRVTWLAGPSGSWPVPERPAL